MYVLCILHLYTYIHTYIHTYTDIYVIHTYTINVLILYLHTLHALHNIHNIHTYIHTSLSFTDITQKHFVMRGNVWTRSPSPCSHTTTWTKYAATAAAAVMKRS